MNVNQNINKLLCIKTNIEREVILYDGCTEKIL